MHHSPTTKASPNGSKPVYPRQPIGTIAAMIAKRVSEGTKPLIYIAETGRRRQDIFRLASLLSKPGSVCEFMAPDGFPGDGLPVTAAIAGNRMAMLRWLRDPDNRPSVVITTPAALIRKVPPRSSTNETHLEIAVGETIDVETLKSRLSSLGYWLDDRVDEAGEAAFRGKVIEIFPAAAPRPCRIEHDDGHVIAIRSYDPISQRSVAQSNRLIVDAASEIVGREDGISDDGFPGDAPKSADDEAHAGPQFLCRHYEASESLFDCMPKAEIILEDGADLRAEEVFAALSALDDESATAHAIRSDHLDRPAWDAALRDRLNALVGDVGVDRSVPVFAMERQPFKAFAKVASAWLDEGYRLVLAGRPGRNLKSAARRASKALGAEFETVDSWAAVTQAKPGSLSLFEAAIDEGFVAPDSTIVLVSLQDLEGQKAAASAKGSTAAFNSDIDTFFSGDKVVHIEHGVAILEGLTSIDASATGAEDAGEALVLRFRKNETLLVPMSDIGAVWRYGGPSSDVALDTLKGQSWAKRRDSVFEQVASTADAMVERLKQKAKAKAPAIKPDRVSFERFCARFAYELTPDQSDAVIDVLADLASGRPMDRLVCGDVGYGKTEVALRAAAAAVFAGKQVAVVAPTTVLAQQHYRSFTERFSPQDVQVVRLSRLVDKTETDVAKKALKTGDAKIVVGTHALLSSSVVFDDLALIVIDEEQRFGSEAKAEMRDLADGLHCLAMTATPIPRTLQAGFVGLNDLSIIATPPIRRSPVRTETGPFDDERVRKALKEEHQRGGQSFVVCPRIDDLEPMGRRIAELVPDQRVVTLHGKMKADEVEDAMLAFSNGDYDILLATTIVESGLDVANANTMVVCRADRFGLAELHQLRGRVGRGVRRGHVLLTTDEGDEIGEDAEKRLKALVKFNTLGAGFDIAARDLDLRGTGDLLGEEQAGHVQTIGIGLYRKMLEQAIGVAEGGPSKMELRPVVSLGLSASIPADYVPEPDMRIELALLLERVDGSSTLEALKAEIEDRFGPMPKALETSFQLAELRLRCAELGVTKLDLGPKATALSLTPQSVERLTSLKFDEADESQTARVRWSKQRLLFEAPENEDADRIDHATGILDRLEALLLETGSETEED